MAHNLELQVRVSKMLGCGFALTLVTIGGIGSFIAFIIGLRARRIIKRTEFELYGLGLAWWCIIVGGLQMIILPPLMIALIIRHLK